MKYREERMDTQGVLVDGGAPALTEVKPALDRGLGKSWMSWDTTVSSSHHIPGLSPALLQVSNQTWFFHDAQPAQGPEARSSGLTL